MAPGGEGITCEGVTTTRQERTGELGVVSLFHFPTHLPFLLHERYTVCSSLHFILFLNFWVGKCCQLSGMEGGSQLPAVVKYHHKSTKFTSFFLTGGHFDCLGLSVIHTARFHLRYGRMSGTEFHVGALVATQHDGGGVWFLCQVGFWLILEHVSPLGFRPHRCCMFPFSLWVWR